MMIGHARSSIPLALCILFLFNAVCSAALRRIGVMSAFGPELAAIEKEMIAAEVTGESQRINGTVFKSIEWKGRRLIFFLSGVSMVNAAMTAQLAIDRFGLDALLFSGIAGGINPRFQPGDVVVPDRWIHQTESVWANPDPREQGKYLLPPYFKPKYQNFGMIFPSDVWAVRDGETKPRRVHAFPADAKFIVAARKAARQLQLRNGVNQPAQVLIGGNGMSGPVFLDNREFREFAFKTWSVNCHEMEGTAVAQVAYANRVPVLIVRGLSDLAGSQHGFNQEQTYTQLASHNAAVVPLGHWKFSWRID